MDIKGLIFDLDGVIVDTAKYHYVAWQALAQDLGFSFTKQDNERLKGVSRMTSLDILLEIGNISKDESQKAELAEIKNAHYRTFLLKMTPKEILPGALPFLQQAKELGYKLAIGSASKNTPTILQKIGLSNFFDSVVDGNKISKAKPDPEVFLKAAQELGVLPDQSVVFEDAVAGVQAALSGGMYCVGIGSANNLAKANLVVDSLNGHSVNDVLSQIVDIW